MVSYMLEHVTWDHSVYLSTNACDFIHVVRAKPEEI